MNDPIIRVVRQIEYVGAASSVRRTLDRSYVTMEGVSSGNITMRELARDYTVIHTFVSSSEDGANDTTS